MQTNFTPAQLADPPWPRSEKILRKCVHCGFCTATCPTYVMLGNELDCPRGRIYLIKDMLENGRPADEEVVTHIDRCLSCLSCMTTCPSGVNYMHLVDHARSISRRPTRGPLHDRLLRPLLAHVLPYPNRFRLALAAALLGGRLRGCWSGCRCSAPACGDARSGARRGPAPRSALDAAGTFEAGSGERRGRVAILTGCAQPVLKPGDQRGDDPASDPARRRGRGAGGRGLLRRARPSMGREEQALAFARRNVDAWIAEMDGEGLDAIVITASGCGTTIKDYGHMLRLDPAYAEKAARVSALAKDITEYLASLDLPRPCGETDLDGRLSLGLLDAAWPEDHHGAEALLKKAGFTVRDPAKAISVAARPAPTTSCSRRFPRRCGSAR